MSEAVRDRRGIIIGRIEELPLVNRIVARDRHGVVVGTYDTHADLTRDAGGKIVGKGNLLMMLLAQ